ncbi:hypothetical protein KKE60_06605 [Patescibacteria group bacterium]|nr:hypothetical protein [Patescibacteria group bacterium]
MTNTRMIEKTSCWYCGKSISADEKRLLIIDLEDRLDVFTAFHRLSDLVDELGWVVAPDVVADEGITHMGAACKPRIDTKDLMSESKILSEKHWDAFTGPAIRHNIGISRDDSEFRQKTIGNEMAELRNTALSQWEHGAKHMAELIVSIIDGSETSRPNDDCWKPFPSTVSLLPAGPFVVRGVIGDERVDTIATIVDDGIYLHFVFEGLTWRMIEFKSCGKLEWKPIKW